MKRYIRSSISVSAPAWLKEALKGYFGKQLRTKANIAIDRAEFKDHSEYKTDKPIYLLQTDFGNHVYCPGVNDDDDGYFNNRNRKFGSIAKSKLPDMAVDVVFVDFSDPVNLIDKKERYRDPRYSYGRYDTKGQYAGQYMTQRYEKDEEGNYQYIDDGWSPAGRHPNNERASRDKSGYKIPTPESKIADYYTRLPERVTDKVDRLYERIQEVKSELMEADLNTPADYSGNDISRAFRYFGDAVSDYRNMLRELGSERRLSEHDIEWSAVRFSQSVRDIKDRLKEVEEMLGLY